MNFLNFFKSRVFWVNLALAVIVFFITIFLIMQMLKWYTHHGESVTVPTLKGLSFEQAKDKLNDLGLEFSVIDSAFDPKKPAFSILDQNPIPGSKVKESRTIYLTINSKTPPNREVPDLVNKSSLKFARIQLESRGFKVGTPIYKDNPDLNAVLEMLCNGKPIRKGDALPVGSTITLVLGNGMGNTLIDVPLLIGLTLEEARFTLAANGLVMGSAVPGDGGVTDSTSARVYMQMPEPGNGNQIRVGEPIDVFYKQNVSQEEIDKYKEKMQYNMTVDTVADPNP